MKVAETRDQAVQSGIVGHFGVSDGLRRNQQCDKAADRHSPTLPGANLRLSFLLRQAGAHQKIRSPNECCAMKTVPIAMPTRTIVLGFKGLRGDKIGQN